MVLLDKLEEEFCSSNVENLLLKRVGERLPVNHGRRCFFL